MAKILYLGGSETGDLAHLAWGRFVFEINKWVECDDPHIVAKAAGNRFFKVDNDEGKAAQDKFVRAWSTVEAATDPTKPPHASQMPASASTVVPEPGPPKPKKRRGRPPKAMPAASQRPPVPMPEGYGVPTKVKVDE